MVLKVTDNQWVIDMKEVKYMYTYVYMYTVLEQTHN